jgi:hypothetical protein
MLPFGQRRQRRGTQGTVAITRSDDCGSYSDGPDRCSHTGRSRNSGRRAYCFPSSHSLGALKPGGGVSSGAKHVRGYNPTGRVSPWRSYCTFHTPNVRRTKDPCRFGQTLGEHPWQNATPNEAFRSPEVSQARKPMQWRILELAVSCSIQYPRPNRLQSACLSITRAIHKAADAR